MTSIILYSFMLWLKIWSILLTVHVYFKKVCCVLLGKYALLVCSVNISKNKLLTLFSYSIS